jgi:multidrug resistance efflux pump
VEVKNREVVEVYVATGRIEAPRTSDLGVDVAGTVERIAVEEGAEVAQGDAVVELRPRNAELAVEQAEARVQTLRSELAEIRRGATDADIRAAQSEVDQFASTLEQAKRELERTEKLYEREAATEQELEQARTSVEQAQAQLDNAEARLERLREKPLPEQVQAARSRLEQAKVDLERARNDVAETVVRAPFDGLVLEINADDGERVTPNQTVARMADMSSAEVYAEVDEDYFGRLEPGQPVTLIFPSMPEETFPAEIERVGPEISTDRGVVGVHIAPENLPENAFPGLTVDANIEVARLDKALAAPTEAVVRDPKGTYVLTIEDGTATRTPVDIRARGDRWMALEGIEAGTRIIRNAARVEIGESVAPAAGGGG